MNMLAVTQEQGDKQLVEKFPNSRFFFATTFSRVVFVVTFFVVTVLCWNFLNNLRGPGTEEK
jgi:hypothetical protein